MTQGQDIYDLIKELFPICRSLTGDGVRKSLGILQKYVPLKIHEVPTGTQVFDWVVPKEWNIKDAFIVDAHGNRIVDFKKNNLHVVGYSIPVNKTVSAEELQEHLHSLPEQPDAIPYVTFYYKESWGFCLTHRQRRNLCGEYRVVIDSELKPGSLTYGELIIPGQTKEEVFLSTNICHPSMANNELSGPAVLTYLAKWIMSEPRKFTYRLIFVPETIGAICYLSKHLEEMRLNGVVAGFNISCVGDEGHFSYVPTVGGDTYTDRIALNILSSKDDGLIKYSFLQRGSDERQYNSPGVDLPVCCITRSKFHVYPEYHTSLDDLSFVSAKGLFGSYDVLMNCLMAIEKNNKYRTKCLAEPQLGKRGLYPNTSSKLSMHDSLKAKIIDFLAYADGKNDLIDISNKTKIPVWEFYSVVSKLLECGLI